MYTHTYSTHYSVHTLHATIHTWICPSLGQQEDSDVSFSRAPWLPRPRTASIGRVAGRWRRGSSAQMPSSRVYKGV